MLEAILILAFLVSPLIFLLLFIICACKISSMCSRIEELEEREFYLRECDEDDR